ncbi:MAG TPA: hypothetical protein VFJ02_17885 [Vicinamibacterales bacterium]|nr:hypothetical protein [Vicinamibacterales bacterium]
MIRRIALLLPAASLFVVTACASRLPPLPPGPGTPFAEYASAYAEATGTCRNVRTMAAVLEISGRAAGSRFPRAKVDAGFEAPGKMVLELPAPGRPFFTFAVNSTTATLVLPRDGRVLKDAPPADTLEALAGISLTPDELRQIVTGCGFGGEPAAGRTLSGEWAAVDAGGAVAYLQQVAGPWRLTAATRGAIEVRYADFAGGRPSTIRLRTNGAGRDRATDLTIRTSQVDINEPIAASAFQPEIPAGARPMTLDELRQAGPLGR